MIGRASTAQKNRALHGAATALDAARLELVAANELDLAAGRANGLEPAMLERLALTYPRIDSMIVGLRQVASLPDPIGAIRDMSYRPSGIQVGKMRVPLGVVGIIYESRPNVTIDAASLCLKSGKCDDLTRWFRSHSLQPCHCGLHSARAGRGRSAASRGASG